MPVILSSLNSLKAYKNSDYYSLSTQIILSLFNPKSLIFINVPYSCSPIFSNVGASLSSS